MKMMSKNKWNLGGIVAFASVALISTGFAAWQIGLSTKEANNNLIIGVDGVTNNTVSLTVTLTDNSITLADTTATTTSEGTYITSDGKGDLNIAGTVRLEVSPSYLESNTINSVDFTFSSGTGIASNKVSDATNANATGFHSDSIASLTYFDLVSSSLTFPSLNDDGSISGTASAWTKGDNNGNNYVYTSAISGSSPFFKWGTYFESATSVSTYYNTKIKAQTSETDVVSLLSKVETELTAMKNQYEGKSIQLKASLNTTSKA